MLARRSTEMSSPPMIREVLETKLKDNNALQQQCLYLPEKDSTGMQRMRRIVVKQEEKNRILKMCHDGVHGIIYRVIQLAAVSC